MMRLSQSYHTRGLPADSALWGRLRRNASPGLPEVATFQKAGIKGFIEPWFGVFVPAGTPAAIVTRLNCLLSYANFNGMQIRACRRSTEPAWVAQSGAPPAPSSV
jgi:tripartite-type tricarboxylate transporter receptor subunit TctC